MVGREREIFFSPPAFILNPMFSRLLFIILVFCWMGVVVSKLVSGPDPCKCPWDEEGTKECACRVVSFGDTPIVKLVKDIWCDLNWFMEEFPNLPYLHQLELLGYIVGPIVISIGLCIMVCLLINKYCLCMYTRKITIKEENQNK